MRETVTITGVLVGIIEICHFMQFGWLEVVRGVEQWSR